MTQTLLRSVIAASAVAVLAATGGCTMKEQNEPPLTGPSELGLSVTLTASPDVLTQDGASQSVITAVARNASGQPAPNVALYAAIYVNGSPVDFGRLSAKNIATDSSGRATIVYTAPAAPVVSVGSGTVVTIAFTPVGTDAASANPRVVSIRLVPPGIILPPNGTPAANFTFAPASPRTGEKITFDASSSNDDGTIVSYNWSFSDGDTRTGRVVQIAFDVPGTYAATLTVTDDRGLSSSTTKTVTVSVSDAPTASFVFSPATVNAGATVFFNASNSSAAAGRTIVSYEWNFGDGSTGTGVTTSHVFASANSYNVTLTVTDDVGRRATATMLVTVLP